MNILLIDINNLAYRAVSVNAGLTFGKYFTGGLYGFINSFAKAVVEYDIDRAVFCTDSKPYRRSEVFADYKGNRSKTTDEAAIQRRLDVKETKEYVRTLADLMMIPWVAWDGYEADDIIAWIAMKQRLGTDKIYILSNDSDLYQLFRYPEVYIVKKSGIYGKKEFLNEFGISPRDWTVVSAMAGTHNALPGIQRVGVKTAIKILKDEHKFEKTLTKHAEIIERNEPLIKLPHPDLLTEPPTPIEFTYWKYTERHYVRFISKFGISLTQRMRDAFDRMDAWRYK